MSRSFLYKVENITFNSLPESNIVVPCALNFELNVDFTIGRKQQWGYSFPHTTEAELP